MTKLQVPGKRTGERRASLLSKGTIGIMANEA